MKKLSHIMESKLINNSLIQVLRSYFRVNKLHKDAIQKGYLLALRLFKKKIILYSKIILYFTFLF